jgi:amidohydrolase
MQEVQQIIKKLASEYSGEITAIRRHFHRNPELSLEEFQTADFICKKLDEYGIPFVNGIAGTGIVALIHGKETGTKCVALRADMDALPLTEKNEVEYKSAVPGKMHACGHDVHMACLLGAARILTEMKDRFPGTVKLLFQPSEETYPGGAIQMIEAGVLKDPEPDFIIAQHVINTLEAGEIGMAPGPYMASTDEIFLTVRGKGGHAATPDQVIDPILIASHIVVAVQQIVSRKANPLMPTVVSFGKITGEGRTNIIPGEVRLEGTVRTYDETWRADVHTQIQKIASSISEGMGGSCDFRVSGGYPFLNNDPRLTVRLNDLAVEYAGKEKVKPLEKRMTAEDFAYFAAEKPSCLYRLGIANRSKGIVSNLHSDTFDVDERCMETGSGLMAWFAINLLSR